LERKRDKGKRDGATADAVSVVAHPRARRSIRRLRARAGLIALHALTGHSQRAGVPPFDAVLRGLAGGVAAHFVAWGAGVVAWRHLVMAEIAAHRDAQEARLRELREAAEQRTADALAAKA
jgi:hypothetical protein